MKKHYVALTASLLFSSLFAAAQIVKPRPFVVIGPDATYATTGAYEAGLGGAVKLGLPVSTNGAFTLTTGFQHYKGQPVRVYGQLGHASNKTVVPVRAGFRYNVYKRLYLEPQLGYSRVFYTNFNGSRPPSNGAFSHAIIAGFDAGKRLDIAARYEGHDGRMHRLNAVGLSVGYKLNYKNKVMQ